MRSRRACGALEQLVTFYAIFEPGSGKPDLPAAIPDRFSGLAFWLPPVFALGHGLWLAFVGFVLVVASLVLLTPWLGAAAALALYLLLALSFGFAAPALRRRKLRRLGWAYRRELWASHPELARLEVLR
jgi:hypothetical protein